MPGYLERTRASRLMAERELEAIVLVQPESIQYATGAFPGVATLWRRAGAAAVVVPADPAAPLCAVVGDLQAAAFRNASGIEDTRAHPIWVESTVGVAQGDLLAAIQTHDATRGAGFARPATFDPARALGLLRDIMVERGLDRAAVGLELGFVPVADMAFFTEALPHVQWKDATPVIERLRMIKHPAEVERLRTAALLTAAGLGRLIASLRAGLDAVAMEAIWREAVRAEAAARRVAEPVTGWAYIAVGPDGFARGGPAVRGDVVKMDVGAVVGGYSADMARTAVMGPASANQKRVHGALLEALEAALAALVPGRPLREAHRAASEAMTKAGFASFSRGHFGHGLGASIFSEEWPFIAADSDIPVEPGMVLAVEAPYYVSGLGGFIIEDQFLVTETGLEPLAELPRDLVEIHA